MGVTKDFAGINVRELVFTKDYAGINFRDLYKALSGINFTFVLRKFFSTTLVYGFENDILQKWQNKEKS